MAVTTTRNQKDVQNRIFKLQVEANEAVAERFEELMEARMAEMQDQIEAQTREDKRVPTCTVCGVKISDDDDMISRACPKCQNMPGFELPPIPAPPPPPIGLEDLPLPPGMPIPAGFDPRGRPIHGEFGMPGPENPFELLEEWNFKEEKESPESNIIIDSIKDPFGAGPAFIDVTIMTSHETVTRMVIADILENDLGELIEAISTRLGNA